MWVTVVYKHDPESCVFDDDIEVLGHRTKDDADAHIAEYEGVREWVAYAVWIDPLTQ